MTFPETIYTIDGLFILFVLLFGVAGFFRGLTGELSRLLSFIFLIGMFGCFYPELTQQTARSWTLLPAVAVQWIVAALFFIAGLGLYFALYFLFKRFLKELIRGFVDKMAGMFFGLMLGVLIGLTSLSAVSLIPHSGAYRVLSEQSVVGAWICENLTPWLHLRLMELPGFDKEEN